MNRTSLVRSVIVGLALVGLTSSLAPATAQAEPLYFALEVRREGHLVAQPKLLGETGRTLRAERRKPGAAQPDYQLILTPIVEGGTYHLSLELMLPDIRGKSELALLHGQQHKLQLGKTPGELEVSLLLMKVDSPEFRALMDLAADSEGHTGSRPI
ncbi:MAG: hypothetical protein ACJ8AT_09100 [Hyalangium sp.]|uniref:hypothetical protein n=1 Tax=Hyalangium sp. TaxID=2028555 RepID=UPI00389B12A5